MIGHSIPYATIIRPVKPSLHSPTFWTPTSSNLPQTCGPPCGKVLLLLNGPAWHGNRVSNPRTTPCINKVRFNLHRNADSSNIRNTKPRFTDNKFPLGSSVCTRFSKLCLFIGMCMAIVGWSYCCARCQNWTRINMRDARCRSADSPLFA